MDLTETKIGKLERNTSSVVNKESNIIKSMEKNLEKIPSPKADKKTYKILALTMFYVESIFKSIHILP